MAKSIRSILFGGMLAGVLDLGSAILTLGARGVSPDKILQAIASGILGAQSYRGGIATVVLGAALHFFIACSAAAAFYAGSRRIHFLTRHPIVSGLLYGPLVYTVMTGVVVPLSAMVPKRPVSFQDAVTGAVTLSLLVGLPISLVVWRSSADPQASSLVPGDNRRIRFDYEGNQ